MTTTKRASQAMVLKDLDAALSTTSQEWFSRYEDSRLGVGAADPDEVRQLAMDAPNAYLRGYLCGVLITQYNMH